jgi:hypothetical protein
MFPSVAGALLYIKPVVIATKETMVSGPEYKRAKFFIHHNQSNDLL